MAAVPTKSKPKISDVYNAFSNPSGSLSPSLIALMGGGNTSLTSFPPTGYAKSTPAVIPRTPVAAPVAPAYVPPAPVVAAPVTQKRTLSQVASGAPVAPRTAAAPTTFARPETMGPAFGSPANAAGTPAETAPSEVPVPRQWMKADGTFKTPEEIAAEIGTTLKNASGTGDIGRISLNQFGADGKTAEQLATEARRIGNTRNDIAAGETDPYKVASDSGIAYTAAELAAIEKAYAGIYDPALDSALSKVEEKRTSDARAAEAKAEEDRIRLRSGLDLDAERERAKLAAEADANAPYTLGEGQVRYDGKGNVIAKGPAKTFAPSSGSGSGSGTGSGSGSGYVQGANPVVDGWVDRILKSGEDLSKAIPGVANTALRNQVMLGLNARKYESAQTAGTLNDVNTLNLLLENPGLDNISGFLGQTGVTSLFGKAKTAKTQFDQIAGTLQLAKAGQIKGQGAVSDYERSVLKQAAVIADRGQGDEDFRDALIKIRGAMMTASGLEAPVRITDPSTGRSEVQRLSSNEITDFIRDGALIEYVEEQ